MLGGGVDEQKIFILHPAPVLDVVEDAGVASRRHYRWIADALRAAPAEDGFHRRLHLVLVEPRLSHPHRLHVAFGRQGARRSQRFLLFICLPEPQIGEHRAQVQNVQGNGRPVRRVVGAHGAQHAEHRVVVRAAHAVVEAFPPDGELAHLLGEVTDLVGGVRPVSGLGPLDARAIPVPHLHLPIAGTDEERELGFGVARGKDGHSLGLAEPGEKEEGGVLAERVGDVVVANRLPCRWDHHQSTLTDRGGESVPVLGEAICHRAGPPRSRVAKCRTSTTA